MGRSVAILADHTEYGPNRIRAIERYAEAMDWTYRVLESTELLDTLASASIDLVLCWRFDELPDVDTVLMACQTNGVSILALAQSCSALAE